MEQFASQRRANFEPFMAIDGGLKKDNALNFKRASNL